MLSGLDERAMNCRLAPVGQPRACEPAPTESLWTRACARCRPKGMTRRRTTRVSTVGLASALLLLVSLLTPPVTQGATTTPSPVHNARLQALLDELVATGASGAIARVDDGEHTW